MEIRINIIIRCSWYPSYPAVLCGSFCRMVHFARITQPSLALSPLMMRSNYQSSQWCLVPGAARTEIWRSRPLIPLTLCCCCFNCVPTILWLWQDDSIYSIAVFNTQVLSQLIHFWNSTPTQKVWSKTETNLLKSASPVNWVIAFCQGKPVILLFGFQWFLPPVSACTWYQVTIWWWLGLDSLGWSICPQYSSCMTVLWTEGMREMW